MERIGGLVSAGVVIALVLFFYNSGGKAKADKEILYRAQQIVSHCETYRHEQGYLLDLCRNAHASAFQESYTRGGRRRRAQFDTPLYLELLFEDMIARAQGDGNTKTSKALEKLRDDYFAGKIKISAAEPAAAQPSLAGADSLRNWAAVNVRPVVS